MFFKNPCNESNVARHVAQLAQLSEDDIASKYGGEKLEEKLSGSVFLRWESNLESGSLYLGTITYPMTDPWDEDVYLAI